MSNKSHRSLIFHYQPPGHRLPERLPQLLLFGQRFAFLVAEAAHDVIVDEAGRLHVRVHDGAADEFETALFEVLAHGVGFR